MEQKICAFTGHRPKSFPWKNDEAARDCVLLKEALATQIASLVHRGVTDFLSGMALGADLWASQSVLDLRQGNTAIKLHCILPCEGQAAKWSISEQAQYRSILEQANSITYVSQVYNRDCMLKRNRFLVEHASILLAVYNGTARSGTGMTVRYAQRLGREVIILHPITRQISLE